jgi:predicted helicase
LEKYQSYPKITDIFPVNSVGIVTSRDDFIIDMDKEVLKRRINMFCDPKIPVELIAEPYNLKDKTNWNLKASREKLINDKEREDSFTQILYRPFDMRWIFYHEVLVERSRKEVMKHMMKKNLGLISARSNKSNEMNHFFCTNTLIETKCGESTTQSCLFPLYLYTNTSQKTLFSIPGGHNGKETNINKIIINELIKIFNQRVTQEDIFYFIYTILYSNTYRLKYKEFLRLDFPRIPFTKDYDLFIKLAAFW